ncbi:amino acid transporter AVT1J-like [Andrographis paniculata]|uniref:amino acid transporter AVT1J-like n=1 Tax=Andrographis paniculata TaxID=175694 RepID=UPI0021E95CBC|nr:amino acid transporter AVT1J-like [Andrographis paniculata]
MKKFLADELTKCKMQDSQHATVPLLPELNRHNSAGTTSFLKTIFNGLNALSGLGILSVPYALSSGGWLSLILMIIIAATTFYTGLLIKRCMEDDPCIRSYPDIGYKAFGSTGRLIISILMNLELYLVATGSLILLGDNLHRLLPNVEIHVYGDIVIGGRQSLVLLVAIVMMPTVWIDNMSTLSYVSATGVFTSLVILGSILWLGVSVDGIGLQHKGVLFDWNGLPTAFSLYTFCFCSHAVFPTLYSSMWNPRQFSFALLLCFMLCTVVIASMAILGYLMFGSDLQSQITLNLPTDRMSAKVAVYTALLNPIAKYGLTLKPTVDSIENHFKWLRENRSRSLFMRTALVGSSVVLALMLPFFGHLMSLAGSLFGVPTSILLPCFCYLKISGAYKRIGVESAVIVFAVSMGIVILVFGTYTSVLQIVYNL